MNKPGIAAMLGRQNLNKRVAFTMRFHLKQYAFVLPLNHGGWP